MTKSDVSPATEQQRAEWVKIQFQRANKHLAENGVLFESVVLEESRYLAPFVAIWKVKSASGSYYWVLSGDLPVDFTLYENAPNAREAIKYFSMSWQLKAENIRTLNSKDSTEMEYANLLQSRAENLYTIQSNDSLWNS